MPQLVGLVVDDDSTRRTYRRTLTAVDAVTLRKRTIEGRHNSNLAASMRKVYSAYALHFATHTHAVAAQDTFVRVSNDTLGALVYLCFWTSVLKSYLFDTELSCQFLQTTVAVSLASGAIFAVAGKQKLEYHLAMLVQSLCVGLDNHSVLWRGGTRSVNTTSIVLYHAHTTRAVYGQIGIVTEGWQFDTCFSDDCKYVLLVGKLYSMSVDNHYSHCFSPP